MIKLLLFTCSMVFCLAQTIPDVLNKTENQEDQKDQQQQDQETDTGIKLQNNAQFMQTGYVKSQQWEKLPTKIRLRNRKTKRFVNFVRNIKRKANNEYLRYRQGRVVLPKKVVASYLRRKGFRNISFKRNRQNLLKNTTQKERLKLFKKYTIRYYSKVRSLRKKIAYLKSKLTLFSCNSRCKRDSSRKIKSYKRQIPGLVSKIKNAQRKFRLNRIPPIFRKEKFKYYPKYLNICKKGKGSCVQFKYQRIRKNKKSIVRYCNRYRKCINSRELKLRLDARLIKHYRQLYRKQYYALRAQKQQNRKILSAIKKQEKIIRDLSNKYNAAVSKNAELKKVDPKKGKFLLQEDAPKQE